MNGDEDEEEEGEGEGEGEEGRKGVSYPPEFPVGKTVFLENDRRRAGWIPAVVSTNWNIVRVYIQQNVQK